MPTQIIPLEGIETVGMVRDTPPIKLPPGAWTDAMNVRFDDGAIRRMQGQVEIFASTMLTDIRHIAYWENPNVRCYVVINRETDGDHAYLVRIDGAGETVVADKGTFMSSDSWTSSQFNGGYSIIINNAIDAPQHITVQLGGTSNINGIAQFSELPNWDSYASGSYLADFLSVSADIIIPYGNLLVAGALTERSSPQLPAITTGVATNTNSQLSLTLATTPSVIDGDTVELRGDPDYTFTWTVAGDGTLLEPDVAMTRTVTSPYNGSYRVVSTGANSVTLNKIGNTFGNTVVRNVALVATDFGETTTTFPASLEIDFSTITPEFTASGDITMYHTLSDGLPVPTEIVRDLSGVVRSSSVAAPGAIPNNWNPFATGAGTADEINLADAGRVTAIRELRGNMFVFTSDTITQLRVSGTGLTAVPITKQYGAAAQNSVFPFNGTLIIVGSDDIYIFSGNPGDIKSISDGKVRKFFYEQIDPLNFRYIQMVRNQLFDEIWLCYPRRGSDLLNMALVWDYTLNTWSQRELPGIRSLTVGPIPGASTGGTELVIPNDATGYTLTVTNANGQTTVQNSPIGTYTDVANLNAALAIDIEGQAGLAAMVTTDGELVVNNIHTGLTPWIYTVTINNDVAVTTREFTGSVDNFREWSQALLNEAQNFIVMAGGGTINAAEIGWAGFVTNPYFERTHLQFAPTRETERLRGLYINSMSPNAAAALDISVSRRDTPGGLTPILQDTPNIFNIQTDYKTDYHITSRLIDMRFSSSVEDRWEIADISLEIGGGGTR